MAHLRKCLWEKVAIVYGLYTCNQLLNHFFHIHTANFRIPTKTGNYSQLFKLLYRIRGRVMWNLIVTLRMNVWVMNDIGMRAVVLWALIIVLVRRAILHEGG